MENLSKEFELQIVKEKFKIKSIFPIIKNRSSFLFREHPEYHPDTKDYMMYWEEHEKRCIEGYWGLDKNNNDEGGFRWAPPQLYYYINFCVIEDEKEDSNSSDVIIPDLRDVEWGAFYRWIISRGFSGFENDENYTCSNIIKKLENKQELTVKENERLKKLKNVYKKDGTYKKYVDPLPYLYGTFKKPLGLPLYENTAKDMLMMTARGTGKSFIAMGIISHTYKFHGATRYDESYFKLKKGPEIIVGSSQGDKSADLLKKFMFNENYQANNFGSYGSDEEFEPGFFYTMSSGSLMAGSKSSFRNEYEYVEGGVRKKGGKFTKIKHVTYEKNPEAAVGSRATLMVHEEVGLSTEILKIKGANRNCMIRKTKFGSELLIGTAGNINKIHGCKTMFEDPEAYDLYSEEDVWEMRQKPIAFFIPAYYRDNDFRDENGNQNIELAFAQEMYERKKLSEANNSLALDIYILSNPLLPSELFLSATANVFPISKLREREIEVNIKNIFEIQASIGELIWDKNKQQVNWKEDLTRKKFKPITSLNLDKYAGRLEGCVVIYEHPDDSPSLKRSLYKVVYDPVKDDHGGTSLASIIVYKGVSEDNWSLGTFDDVVAEYIGRFDLVEDIHDLVIKIATYYNAKIMVETNIPDFIRYCKNQKKSYFLQATPYETISKVIKDPGKKYGVGIDMSSPSLHIHAEQLIRQWLLTKWKVRDNIQLYNLDKIKSPRLLQELQQYTREGNFDHISSFKLLVLWLAQENQVPVKKNSEVAKETLNSFFNQVTKNTSFKSNPYYNF